MTDSEDDAKAALVRDSQLSTQRRKRRALAVMIIFVIITTGIALISLRELYGSQSFIPFTVIGYGSIIIAGGMTIYLYLQTPNSSLKRLSEFGRSNFSYDDDISNYLSARDINPSSDGYFDHLRKRNLAEISRVSKSANVNLAFGSVTTFAAVFFLAYQILYSKTPNFADVQGLLSYYIPRVSIVIFVEVFSFFFLRLYKANLADIKYYQNELTNIEFKFLALTMAEKSGDQESIKAAISTFLTTERNFILKKDESTIELEKDKIQQQSNQNIADFLKDIVKSNNK